MARPPIAKMDLPVRGLENGFWRWTKELDIIDLYTIMRVSPLILQIYYTDCHKTVK